MSARIGYESARKYGWLEAMDAAAGLLQKSVLSEQQVYVTFQEQISNLGLRGGISMLTPDRSQLSFRSVAQPGKKSILSRLESLLNLKTREFTIEVEQVEVYHQVLMESESIFVRDTKQILLQMLSFSDQSLVAKVVEAFGRDPAIYSPLILGDQVEGVLNVAGPDLTSDDLPAMKAFANYISAALSNARLFENIRQQEEAYRSLFDNLPVGIFRVTPDGKFLMANPVFLEYVEINRFEDIAGKTLGDVGLEPIHDRGKVLRKLAKDGELIRLETEWRTAQGERKFFKENIKASYDENGEIVYYEGSFEDITERLLTEQALKKQLDDLMILNQVAAVGAGASTLDELVARVTAIIGGHLFSDHFEIFLWEKTEGLLKKSSSYSNDKEYHELVALSPEEGVVGQAFRTGRSVRVDDVQELPNYVTPEGHFRSELCVPIRAGERVIGVLNAERKQVAGFSWEDETLLTTIADQFATAYDRLAFFGEVEGQALQLALLNEAVLSTSRILDADELIRLIAAQIKELFNPDSFVMSLFSESRQELEIAIAVTQGERDEGATGTRIPLDQAGLTTLVVETGQVLHVDDLENSPLIVGYDQIHTRMEGSWVGVPLISGKKVIGALAVQYFDKMVIDKEQTQFLVSMASHAAIAISNGKVIDDIQARFALSRTLAQISEQLNRTQSYREVIETVGTSAMKLMGNACGAVYQFGPDGRMICEWWEDLPEKYVRQVAVLVDENDPGSITPLIVNDTGKWESENQAKELSQANDIHSISFWPLVFEGEAIAVVGCFSTMPHEWTEDEQDAMLTFSRQAAIAVQNARLLEAERTRRQEAEALYKTTAALTSSLDVDKVLDNILVELYRVVDYTSASLQMLEGDTVRIVAVQGLLLDTEKVVGLEYSASNEIFSLLMRVHEPIILENAIEDERFEMVRPVPYVRGWIGVPLVVGENMIGALTIDSDEIGAFNEADAQKAQAFANQAAIAIETASLFTQTQRRLNVLQSIHTIDQAISRSMDLSMTLDVFVEQALNLLDVDVIRVFSYDSDAQVFEPIATRDQLSTGLFAGKNFYHRELAEAAILERAIKSQIADVSGAGLSVRSLASYFVIPLVTRGEIRGVIEALARRKLAPNDEWLDLLSTLATQAGIAIESEELLSSLRRSNEELIIAYDRTLEGWAYALELRDRETVGHSRRVTELTVRLSRRMGIGGVDLANIRRGTLLHDIGKMGLPDSVLLKKGPLTKEEEEIMQTHPQLAYDMLVSIPYLKPALEIPFYHHEKWDGTGYPHGLKGEDIPLPARIFSVVDVWDAVVFDRPYRGAWTKQEALDYIKAQSGKHFDPRVVEHFIEIIRSEMEQ